MRERMVTRTIRTAKLCVLMCDTVNEKIIENYVSISAEIPEEKMLKYLAKNCPVENCVYISVKSKVIEEKIYGLSEVDFMKYAVEMDKRYLTKGEEKGE
ncbi:MAG: hypothetical protein J6T10_30590 [Methanobrevibacter sp.]|nr:hypothetical protein [Methanobrevibacter sp.]